MEFTLLHSFGFYLHGTAAAYQLGDFLVGRFLRFPQCRVDVLLPADDLIECICNNETPFHDSAFKIAG